MSFSGFVPFGFCGSIVTRLKTPRLYSRLCDSTTSPSRSGSLTLMCTSRWISSGRVSWHQPDRLGLLNRPLGLFFLLFFFSIFLRGTGASSGVRFLRPRTSGDEFGGCRKAGPWKSFVKIKCQDVVPVGRHAEIGIWLAWSRTDHAEKFVFLERMIPLDRQRSDAGLLSFLNREADKQVTLFPLVVVFDLLFDPGIEKPVRLV